MNKKIELGYTSSSGNTNMIEIEVSEKALQILQSLNSPVHLIKNAGNLGIKGITGFVMTIICSVSINFLFIIWSLILLIFYKASLYAFIISLGTGLIFVIISIKRAYGYVAINIMKTIYNETTPLFEKLCDAIVTRVSNEVDKQKKNNNITAKTIHLNQIITNNFGNLPSFSKKAFSVLLNRIPFTGIINNDIMPLLLQGKKDEAAKVLYTKMDTFLNDNIFGNNTMRWILWVIPLNILIHLTIIILS